MWHPAGQYAPFSCLFWPRPAWPPRVILTREGPTERQRAMTIALDLASARNDEEVLSAIVRYLRADSGTIHLIGADGMLHLAAATPGFPQIVLDTIRTIPVGKGMAGLAVERGEPVDACNIQ